MARTKPPKQRAAAGTLGKTLTRRSKGRCELCDERIEVRVFELAPFPEDPDPERAIMGCSRCRAWLEKGTIDPVEAHFLGGAVWSELPPVRLAAARMLLSHEDPDDPWMAEALEVTNVDPETLEFRA